MARIRSIHPKACTSEKLAAISAEAERCYWRLQTHCDDEGRCEDHPRLIYHTIFPLVESATPAKVDTWLGELHRFGLIVRYTVAGKNYLAVTRWEDHQSPKHPRPSQHPAPPVESITPNRGNASPKRGKASPRVGEGEGEGVGEGVGSVTRNDPGEEWETEFAAAWAIYPKRPNNSRAKALRAYQAAKRRGATTAELYAGVEAYAAYCQREGVQPRFVKLAATFFGPDEHWRSDYGPVAADPTAGMPPEVLACRNLDGTFRMYDDNGMPTAAFQWMRAA